MCQPAVRPTPVPFLSAAFVNPRGAIPGLVEKTEKTIRILDAGGSEGLKFNPRRVWRGRS